MTKIMRALMAATVAGVATFAIASPAAAVTDSAGKTVNRLPGRSLGVPPQRKILVCGGSSWGKNVCRPVKSLPLRYQ
jgi:hypothetical protein